MDSEAQVLQRVIAEDLCMGCGMCLASNKGGLTQDSLVYEKEHDLFTPDLGETEAENLRGSETVICPGAGVDMKALSLHKHGRLPDDPLTGVVEGVRVCHATDEEVRTQAASGGVVPALLRRLFESGRVDVVYCLVPGKGPYDAKGRILRSVDELSSIHGSVYHPFDYGSELHRLVHKEKSRFAVVGLPCQIAGIEILKRKYPAFSQRHVLSIGLFCGGVNRFDGIRYYLKGFNIDLNEVKEVSYRHGPWPGKIRVVVGSEQEERLIPRIASNSRWKIMRYLAAFQGYWMLKRCRMCPDQISDFADIAVGDPHVSKYRRRVTSGYSLVVSRTAAGESLVKEMIEHKYLQSEDVDRDMIRQTQGYTLDNRRHQHAYRKAAKLLGMSIPEHTLYDGLNAHASFRHYKWAFLDLLKVRIRKLKILRPLYPLWQAFEYLFVSFYPSLFYKRLVNLLFNRGRSEREKEAPAEKITRP